MHLKVNKPIPGLAMLLIWLAGFSAAFIPTSQKKTILGNEIFVETLIPQLREKKLGLVCNQTSVLADGESLIQALQEKDMDGLVVFTPEHGFQGTAEAGADIRDSARGKIPIFSLYGKNKRPTREQAERIDAFVYDIQDVGTRFYTYITTLKYVMQAAAEFGKPVYVLDRPNPAGGHIVEGPLLRPEFESFRGEIPIPVRYGLTIGELALMMRGEGWVPSHGNLQVVRMENWSRKQYWADTGLHWIPTSPNIPFPETALIFPGTGLLGAFTINQGLGTENPFLQFGAPWLDIQRIIQKLDGGKGFGAQLEATTFTPRSIPGKTLHPPYENRLCQGIRVHIIQKDQFYSLRFTLALIKTILEIHPGKIRLYRESLNQMFGNDLCAKFIAGSLSYDDLLIEMEKDEETFLRMRQKYLLYD